MKINWSFNFIHENHMKIELNGFRFWRCINNWCAEEYGHSVFQTDSIHTIPRYQPVIQFQTTKTHQRTLHHNWCTLWSQNSFHHFQQTESHANHTITANTLHHHCFIQKVWWKVHTTTASCQNMPSSMMKFIEKRWKSNSSQWWAATPRWLRDVCDMPSPDPYTLPTRAYSACDERFIHQQHVLRTWRHQWWNLPKTTNIKFVTLMSVHPLLIAWCKRHPITGSRYHSHTRI